MKQTITIALLLCSIGVFAQTKKYQAKFDLVYAACKKAHDRVIELDRLHKIGQIGADPVIQAINDDLDCYYNLVTAKNELDSVQNIEIRRLKMVLDKQLKALNIK